MKKNKIKNTGVEVTELSFGTSSLGSMPDTYGYEVPEQRAQETLKRFFQGPVNLLDTSRNYAMGESEKRIGIAIKENGGWPENFVLSTKIDRNMDTLILDKKRTRESIEESLKALNVDSVDVLFLHDPEYVKDIKNKYNIPILNKDFFIDPYQVFEANKNGADCILIIINSTNNNLVKDLIDASNELGMDFVLEVHNEKEMELALRYDEGIIGINNRNLEDFSVSLDNTIRIFKEFENSLKNKVLISESGFKDKDDLMKIKNETGINNFLIGESLTKSDSITECFNKLTK